MVLLLSLLACAPESGLVAVYPVTEAPADTDPVAPEPDDSDPTPYVVDDTDTEDAPGLTPAQVAAAIERSIDALLAVDPAHLADAYEGIWALRDDQSCPYYNLEYLELYGQYIWYDTCTSKAGAGFDGYAYNIGFSDVVGSYYTYDRYFYVYGSPVEMTLPNGESLVGSGSVQTYDIDYWYYGYRASYMLIQGTWRWEGPTWADSWLARGVSMDLTVNSTQVTNGYATSLSVNGSLSHVDETITAVNFVDVFLMNLAAGTSCAEEPGGTIRVRDDVGYWYDVTFDGPAYAGAPSFPARCDGCGEVWWRGVRLGEACPDTSRLVNWEGRPWN